MGEQKTTASSVNRAKTYQLVLFPLNNGATNVYYVLVLSYIATFGSKVLALSMLFASVMVTGMRLFDAVTDPIIGALMDRTNGRFGKFRPFMAQMCAGKSVDFKDVMIINKYINEKGKILPRRMTGACAKHQRHIAEQVKYARLMALIPFVK